MAQIISRAEALDKVYEAFRQLDFAKCDYATIKKSLVDGLRLHFPEFSDYTESSELIAILELFADLGDLLAYRQDMVSQESFITAQRRDSILRIAKALMYKTFRNVPARGLLKVVSVSTTESVMDGANDLSGYTVRWGDVLDPAWKRKFYAIINAAIVGEFGVVSVNNRVQVDDVAFERYVLNTPKMPASVFPYTVATPTVSLPMDLVPVIVDGLNIAEQPPRSNAAGAFSLLYGADGAGDVSPSTGFFMFTKQGTLQRFEFEMDGVTPNAGIYVPASNVNNIDVWVNQIDPVTKQTIALWTEVDTIYAQSVAYNTVTNGKKYEVETLQNDQIRLIFGDGNLSEIPRGTFEVWVRTSHNEDYSISASDVGEVSFQIPYVDVKGVNQTLSVSCVVASAIVGNQRSESIEHIRANAPAVYATQDRMVSAVDYNTYMLRDPSIAALTAVNRTYVGDSTYNTWYDPSGTHSNVHVFGQDGYVFYDTTTDVQTLSYLYSDDWMGGIVDVVDNAMQAFDVALMQISAGAAYGDVLTAFSPSERAAFVALLQRQEADGSLINVDVVYQPRVITDKLTGKYTAAGWQFVDGVVNSSASFSVIQTANRPQKKFTITRRGLAIRAHSSNVNFWHTNAGDRVINPATFSADMDTLTALRANESRVISLNPRDPQAVTQVVSRTVRLPGALSKPVKFNVVGQPLHTASSKLGLVNLHSVTLVPSSINASGVPDIASVKLGVAEDFGQSEVFDLKMSIPAGVVGKIQLPVPYIKRDRGHSANIATVNSYSTVLAAGQTEVSISGWTYDATLDSLFVFLRGVLQIPNVNYKMDTDSTILLLSAANEGDSIELVSISAGNVVCPTRIKSSMTVGSIRDVDLTWSVQDTNTSSLVMAFINGIKQDTSVYTTQNRTLRLNGDVPVDANTSIVVRYLQPLVNANTSHYQVVVNNEIVPADVAADQSYDGFRGWKKGHRLNVDTFAEGTNALMVFVGGVKQIAGLNFTEEHYTTVNGVDVGNGIVFQDRIQAGTVVEVYRLIDPAKYLDDAVEGDVVVRTYGRGAYAEDRSVGMDTPTQYLDILSNTGNGIDILVKEYVYFHRSDVFSEWIPQEPTYENIRAYIRDKDLYGNAPNKRLWKRARGRNGLNFMWTHISQRNHLVDISRSNVHDVFIMTTSYMNAMRMWLAGNIAAKPTVPSSVDLQTAYGSMLSKAMMSDVVVLRSGTVKVLFGPYAAPELQAKFLVKPASVTASAATLKVRVSAAIVEFFAERVTGFGQTFHFTQLAQYVHNKLEGLIDTIVIVPLMDLSQFGDLFEVSASENEVLLPHVTPADIEIVSDLTAVNMRG